MKREAAASGGKPGGTRALPGRIVAGGALVALLGYGAATLAAETVAGFEGYVPEAYQCPAGVWTKCFGSTRGVTPGAAYTFEECVDSLNSHLAELARPVALCVPSLSGQPDKVKAAAVSMAYNIGPAAFCDSSVARLFRAGNYEAGCRRIAEIYTRAGGRELPGLVRRRKAEAALCLEGFHEITPDRRKRHAGFDSETAAFPGPAR